MFDSIQTEVPGTSWLDLFAGSGSFGIEALSRGARSATFVESGAAGIASLTSNLRSLGLEGERVQLLRRRIPELFSARRPQLAPFDLVSLDPPFAVSRDSRQLEALVAGLARALESEWFSESLLLAWEEPSEAGEPPIPGLRAVETRPFGSSRLRLFRR